MSAFHIVNNLSGIAWIRSYKLSVIGCSAIDTDGDLLDYDLQEVRVSRAILDLARETILVADASKFTRSAPARIASLRDLDMVYTNEMPAPLREIADDAGTNVRLIAT